MSRSWSRLGLSELIYIPGHHLQDAIDRHPGLPLSSHLTSSRIPTDQHAHYGRSTNCNYLRRMVLASVIGKSLQR